ncbi:MAG: sulfotransferase [Synechococcales cyanobacterium CRU_2_2]|nr:sulfotransferase [Synechococcales cyanobacterium CRU_2_2]
MTLNLHPLSGSSCQNLSYLLKTYGSDRAHFPQTLLMRGLSAFGEPERILERRRLRKILPAMQLEPEPIFILGHWRSGTTYLHHLMSQDPRFGYASSYQAWVPELFLGDSLPIRALVSASLPKTRPMDNVEISIHKPEEEELAMAGYCRYSYIHTFFFPQYTREIFRKSVLFEGLSPAEYQHWKDCYSTVLKMASMGCDNRQLLLKSPANTARIPTLLEMFPNAKFIHIYRNPYTVFTSKLHTCQKLIDLWGLQHVELSEIVDNVFHIYREVMQRFVEDHQTIPDGNLVEVSYEAFEQKPIESLAQIYSALGIPGFETVSDHISSYVKANTKYRKNSYELEPEIAKRVEDEWGFALDRWGYCSSQTSDYSLSH